MNIQWLDVPVSDDRREVIGVDANGDFYIPASICSSKMSGHPRSLTVVHAPRGAFFKATEFLHAYPYASGIVRRLVSAAQAHLGGTRPALAA